MYLLYRLIISCYFRQQIKTDTQLSAKKRSEKHHKTHYYYYLFLCISLISSRCSCAFFWGCLMSSLTWILKKSQFHGYIFCHTFSGEPGFPARIRGAHSKGFVFSQPTGFICCHFSSSAPCWRAGLSSASPPISPQKHPSLEKLKCKFQVGILCLCSSEM